MEIKSTIVLLYEKQVKSVVQRFDDILSNEGFIIETDYKYQVDLNEKGWIPVLWSLIGRADAGILIRTEEGLRDQSYRGLNEELFVTSAVRLPLYKTSADFWDALSNEEFLSMIRSDFTQRSTAGHDSLTAQRDFARQR